MLHVNMNCPKIKLCLFTLQNVNKQATADCKQILDIRNISDPQNGNSGKNEVLHDI